jgi:hypothetical protein
MGYEGADAYQPEYELKFLLPASRAAFLRSWIAAAVPPDSRFPPARVVTVYYDTRGLRYLVEKVDSVYMKTKARLRWYVGPHGEPIGSPVFAECKFRVGSAREKVRVRLPITPADLACQPLDAPAWASLLDPLRALGPDLPSDLAPVIRLGYLRCRYSDRTGARVTLDSDIRIEALNRSLLATPVPPTALPTAVFEYKGRVMELPGYLKPVERFGARKGSFSKYLACFEHLGHSFS